MRKKSIKISKQYGLNPSMIQCMCCGKEYGIALLGDSYKDKDGKKAQAPMKIADGFCEDCQSVITAGGIFFIECKDGESGNNPYRTGRICAIKKEAAEKIFNKFNSINYIEENLYEKIFGEAIKEVEQEK